MLDKNVKMVLDVIRSTTKDNEGVIIEPLDLKGGVLIIRYYEGRNEQCAECVMSSDSFRDMVKEMCKIQAPYVKEVEIIPAR